MSATQRWHWTPETLVCVPAPSPSTSLATTRERWIFFSSMPGRNGHRTTSCGTTFARERWRRQRKSPRNSKITYRFALWRRVSRILPPPTFHPAHETWERDYQPTLTLNRSILLREIFFTAGRRMWPCDCSGLRSLHTFAPT